MTYDTDRDIEAEGQRAIPRASRPEATAQAPALSERAALAELVACKDLKDLATRRDGERKAALLAMYESRKGPAWQAARLALAASPALRLPQGTTEPAGWQPASTPKSPQAPALSERALLQRWLDYATKAAGMTEAIVRDNARFKAFMDDLDHRKVGLVTDTRAALATPEARTLPEPTRSQQMRDAGFTRRPSPPGKMAGNLWRDPEEPAPSVAEEQPLDHPAGLASGPSSASTLAGGT